MGLGHGPVHDARVPLRCPALRYKPVQKKSNRRPDPRTATKSLRKRYEGPWCWLAYREERCLFSTHIAVPFFLTSVRRVHSQTFEGGIDAPRFLVSEWFIGNIIIIRYISIGGAVRVYFQKK